MKNKTRNTVTEALSLQNTNNNLLLELVQQGSKNLEIKSKNNNDNSDIHIRKIIDQNNKIIDLLNQHITESKDNHLELKRLLNNSI